MSDLIADGTAADPIDSLAMLERAARPRKPSAFRWRCWRN